MPPPPPSGPPATDDQLRLLWRIAGMAFLLSSEVAAGAGLGWLLDRWLGTGQRWLTMGGIAGIVVGMTGFIRTAFRLNRDSDLARETNRGAPARNGTESEDGNDADHRDLG